MVQSIEKQRADRREIAAAPGWLSFATGIGTTLIDPTVLAPQAGRLRRLREGTLLPDPQWPWEYLAARQSLGRRRSFTGCSKNGRWKSRLLTSARVLCSVVLLGGAGAALLNRAGASAVRRAAEGLMGS